MAAETVISHNVITSGLFPKHMGWSNEVYRDKDDVLVGGARRLLRDLEHVAALSSSALIEHGNYQKLAGLPRLALRRGVKLRVDLPEAHVRMHERAHELAPTARDAGGHHLPDPRQLGAGFAATAGPAGASRRPATAALPAYFANTARLHEPLVDLPGRGRLRHRKHRPRRTSIRSTATASCRAFDPARTSAATTGPPTPRSASIDNDPNWRGMMVSLGGIDKIGPHVGPGGPAVSRAQPGSHEEMRHLPFVAKNADAQVGRIVDALRRRGCSTRP